MTAPAWRLHLGDCAGPDGLASLGPASVDALVTDPPAGIGFMGKSWDSDKGGRQAWVSWMAGVMRECLRVLKPGAHGLVWALPRTSHWTATALEDAGFEIRDVITHHFGTGFPKSLDVSKAIDAAAGAEREVVGKSARHVSGKPGQRTEGLTGTSTFAEAVGMGMYLTAPATPAAKQWAGWGTALKPATEHWILVRKPLHGTVAANIQRHGTGALNIDGCRIGTAKRVPGAPRTAAHPFLGLGAQDGSEQGNNPLVGRWPANLVFTHAPDCDEACAPGCPVAELDTQAGPLVSGGASGATYESNGGYGGIRDGSTGVCISDAGPASRFFYCAKPARSERDAGCASLPPSTGGEATGRKDGAAALNSPRTGAGRGGGARNTHPTVKPTELMEWLIRLITPPGAQLLILDPFAGSGTTGVAAIQVGANFVGWEQSPDYHEIARHRLEHARKEPEQLTLLATR